MILPTPLRTSRWAVILTSLALALPMYVESPVFASSVVTPGLPVVCDPGSVVVDEPPVVVQDVSEIVPDTTVSESTIPDSTVPESVVPETSVPDSTVPESTSTTVPDVSVVDVVEPSVVVCPGVVTNLVAEPGLNSVTLSWVAPVNADATGVSEFVIDVRTEARVVTVPVDQTSVEISGLPNGVEARFVVYAVGPDGAGPASVEVRATPTTGVEGEVAGIIVKFIDPVVVGDTVTVDGPLGVSADFAVVDEVADDVVLIELDEAVSVDEAERIADDLAASADVEWAEPDQFVFTATGDTAQPVSVPSDAEWSSSQWNLWDTYGIGVGDGAGSMTEAWAAGTGAGSTVAVIDTGITAHSDLDAQLVAGYDFVSNPEQLAAARDASGVLVAFDGDYVDTATFGGLGRDSDPSDPGDWRGVTPVRDSSWHGTQMAGVIAAQANTNGIVGVAPGAKIQPIRALSWRGGLLSDIAAAITWASGGVVDGVPANATPSNVINLSFAVETVCPRSLQSAIDGALARGAVVVAAAGNANANVAGFAPANCDGVIAVGATGRDGMRAPYSNWGAGVDVSAPGGSTAGGVLTTSNTGATTPDQASYGNDEGTSVAAAHVAGAAALLRGANPGLTVAEIVERLTGREYVKQFGGATCDSDATKTCGTGILSLAEIAMVRQGAVDYAMQFTGTNQYAVGTGNSAAFKNFNAITIQAWIRLDANASCAGDKVVIRKYFDFGLWCGRSNDVNYWYYTVGRDGATPVTQWTGIVAEPGKWQHLALTRAANQNVVNFYVDGQLAFTGVTGGADTGAVRSSDDDLEIGSYIKQFSFFPGQIDEIRIYSASLSQSQIVTDMHSHGMNPAIASADWRAYYDFNEGSGNTVFNRVVGAASTSHLTTVNSPNFVEVKNTSTVGSDTVVTFPRSYLTAVGGWVVPQGVSSLDVAVVGAGGAGGWNAAAGGGGGGRVQPNITDGSGTVRTVTVGQGGFAYGWANNTNQAPIDAFYSANPNVGAGQSSVFGSLTANGGSRGQSRGWDNSATMQGGAGGSGSSGSGGSGGSAVGLATNGGNGSAGYTLSTPFSGDYGGGGGGGAGWSPTPLGGAAGNSAAGQGGNYNTAGTSAAANRGGGGGGGAGNGYVGGHGGSGVVIVRYATADVECTPEKTTDGSYTVLAFKDVGTCTWSVPTGVTNVDYLVVAGGGGGGTDVGGGGGAGGLRSGVVSLSGQSTASITVGAGGIGGRSRQNLAGMRGTNGGDSTLGTNSTITAVGGGAGGSGGTDPTTYSGLSGGSGGGSAIVNPNTFGSGTSGQGFAGGLGISNCEAASNSYCAGGGGGAGGVGASASTVTTPDTAGAGGIGATWSPMNPSVASALGIGEVSGTNVYFAGGGGGGAMSSALGGQGGLGGGGAGDNTTVGSGFDGVSATGGGGGAGGRLNNSSNDISVGGNGGSGVVVLRYEVQDVDYAMTFDGTSQFASGGAPSLTTDLTIETWVYPTSSCATEQFVVFQENRFGVSCSGGTWRFIFKDVSSAGNWVSHDTGTSVLSSQWQHLAVRRVDSTGVITFALNGQDVFTTTDLDDWAASSDPLFVGKAGNNAKNFAGRIDEVKLWNSTRTQVQIASGMHARPDVSLANLLAYYDFNEGSGSTVYNRKSGAASATNLTTTGSPTFVDVKSVDVSSVAGRSIVTFPRSYITAAGGWTVPRGVTSADVLVVGGGGGGGGTGGRGFSGGGGAGGSVESRTSSTVTSGAAIAVTVGQGGRGGSGTLRTANDLPVEGGTSSFGAVAAPGGGRGGHAVVTDYSSGDISAPSGGSRNGGGGGAQASDQAGATGLRNGGAGFGAGAGSESQQAAGGGAGAGGAGVAAAAGAGGAGGAGAASSITGSAVTYGGGGGGGKRFSGGNAGAGGVGGGGAGGLIAAGASGTVGRGGGGGGAGGDGFVGGSGGSGVVIVSYGVPSIGLTTTCTNPQRSVASDGSGDVIVTFATVQSCTWTPPLGVSSVQALIVGGGGGGGFDGGGGGGGGGVRYQPSTSVTPGVAISVTVGGGGTGASTTYLSTGPQNTTGQSGTNGGNSVFGSATVTGGGGGGGIRMNGSASASGDARGGGGGGGSSHYDFFPGAPAGGSGGAGCSGCTGGSGRWHRGGGGASGAGNAGSSAGGTAQGAATGGNGAEGVSYAAFGSTVFGSGGGGGDWFQSTNPTVGGTNAGRGGRSDGTLPTVGVANTGGGGGGGGVGNQTGANGGSGVVIIRYSTSTSGATTCTNPTTTEAADGSGDIVVRFVTPESCTWTPPVGVTSVRYLIVAGGGGGGGHIAGGGGGGEVVAGTKTGLTSTSNYSITVGAGGSGGVRTYDNASGNGTKGGESSAFAVSGSGGIRAAGGGFGATLMTGGSTGGSGGSGGGGGAFNGSAGQVAKLSSGFGNIGGTGTGGCASAVAGGGGGAGTAGENGAADGAGHGGDGGSGHASDITGITSYYAGGGGGGVNTGATCVSAGDPGQGGLGGGGAAGPKTASTANADSMGLDGVANTGGGGGGATGNGQTSISRSGGNGGSGVVIIRYTPTDASCTPLTYTSGAYTVVEFQTAGTCTWMVPSGVSTVDVLAVGGGGGGGARLGGGGGGGGVVQSLGLTASGTVMITVGAGGEGGSAPPVAGDRRGANGGNSKVDFVDGALTDITATGGGGGGSFNASGNFNGQSGATGGGASWGGTAGTGSAGANGGAGAGDGSWKFAGGGGGGGGASGTVGVAGSTTRGGAGGAGTLVNITGADVVYGGGGGGGTHNGSITPLVPPGLGGLGGGGAGGTVNVLTSGVGSGGVDGVDGLGGGGGGGSVTSGGSETVPGGDGGDGTVIVRYQVQQIPTFTWSNVSKTFGDASYTITSPTASAQGSVISGAFTYSSSDTSVISITGTTATVAGAGSATITATFTPTDTANYMSGGTVTQTVTVSRGAQSALTLTSTSGTYGTAISLTTSGGSGSGAVTYAVSNGTATGCTETNGELTSTTAGTCTVTATQAQDDDYLVESSSATTVTIAKKDLTISGVVVNNKQFDGNQSATLNFATATLVGVASWDNPTHVAIDSSGATGTFNSSAVGTNIGVTVTGVALSGSNAASSYTLSQPTGLTADISTATRTLTFATTSYSKTYGDGTFTVVASPSAGAGTLNYLASGTACSVAQLTGVVTITGQGSCQISATIATDGSYGQASTITSVTVTVARATVTITASSPSVTYGDAIPTITPSYNGFVYGDNQSVLTTAPTCVTVYTPTSSAVSTPATSCSGAVAANYDFQYTPGVVTIARAAQTISFANPAPSGATYGDPAIPVAPTSMSGLVVTGLVVTLNSSNTAICTVSGGGINLVRAGSCTITASQAGNDNYFAATNVSHTFTIDRANQDVLTMTSPATAIYGQTITLASSGGSGTGAVSYGVVQGTCSIPAGNTLVLGDAGSICQVQAIKQTDANHYLATSATQTITIIQAGQTLAFTSTVPVSPVSGGTYTPSATAVSTVTGSSSGVVPTFAATGTCSIANGVVMFNASGNCVVTVSAATSTNFTAAADVTQTIVVGSINQNITFVQPSNVAFGSSSVSMGATASSDLTVTYALGAGTTNSACSVSALGVVTVLAVGTCEVVASQVGDAQFAPASSVTRAFQVLPALPTAPTLASASAGSQSITVAFTAPGFTGGVSIQAYAVVATPTLGGAAVTDTSCVSSPCTITGLANGASYTVTVAAINSAGTGPASGATGALTPATSAFAVGALSAVPGDTVVDLSWTALTPAQLGGGTFTRYEVSYRPAAVSSNAVQVAAPAAWIPAPSTNALMSQATNSYRVTGLNNGTSYDFQVVAITSANATEIPGNTAQVVQYPSSAPSAPQAPTVLASTATDVQFSWSAPLSDGGSVLTAPFYAVTVTSTTLNAATPITCTRVQVTDMFCTATGLTNGAVYMFSVTAENRMGNSPAGAVTYAAPSSDATLSNLVVNGPSAPVTLAPVFAPGTTAYTATVDNAIASVTVTPTSTMAGSTITVNGVAVVSGNASGSIALNVAVNQIVVVVTASDPRFSETYTIDITRGAAPVFAGPTPGDRPKEPGPGNRDLPDPDTKETRPSTPVTIDPITSAPPADDEWDTESMRIVDPVTEQEQTTVVTPDGTWVLDTRSGLVNFTPAEGFYGRAEVEFVITTTKGVTYRARLSVYVARLGPTIPVTGTESNTVLVWGLWLMVAGVLAGAVSRRRRLF